MSDTEEKCDHPNGFGVYGCPCGATRGDATQDDFSTTQLEPKKRRVQVEVLLLNGTYRFYPADGGWKIDTTYRTLVIGKGTNRYIIPLENIDYFGPREY